MPHRVRIVDPDGEVPVDVAYEVCVMLGDSDIEYRHVSVGECDRFDRCLATRMTQKKIAGFQGIGSDPTFLDDKERMLTGGFQNPPADTNFNDRGLQMEHFFDR